MTVLTLPAPAKPARAPKPAAADKPSGWSAYNNLYSSKTATEAPMRKVEVHGNDEVATLEGRVLAVQSRRIIRSKIKDLFARLDTDKDGRLTASELTTAFGAQIAQRIQKSMDANHDGKISLGEFSAALKHAAVERERRDALSRRDRRGRLGG